jgi:hypothetical protein
MSASSGGAGTWVHVVCMQPDCDTEWDTFVLLGDGCVETCTVCMKKLVDAFWAVHGGSLSWDMESHYE